MLAAADVTPPKITGRVLVVSEDPCAVQQLREAMQALALSATVCDSSLATMKLERHKYEAVVIDLAFGDQPVIHPEQLRASPSNKTSVIFAITGNSDETGRALKQGFSFVLEKPLSPEAITRTLKVAYGQIVRERRRYFRCPIVVPVSFFRTSAPEVYGQTINISECGICLRTSTPLLPGTEGTTCFTLPGLPVGIRAESRVRWNNDKGASGLSFLFLPFDVASELQAWLALKLEECLPGSVAEIFSPDHAEFK